VWDNHACRADLTEGLLCSGVCTLLGLRLLKLYRSIPSLERWGGQEPRPSPGTVGLSLPGEESLCPVVHVWTRVVIPGRSRAAEVGWGPRVTPSFFPKPAVTCSRLAFLLLGSCPTPEGPLTCPS
jgi:hypothetical protein